MRITDKHSNYVDVKLRGYSPMISLSYNLERVSSLRYVVLDRGATSDKYETEVEIYGTESYIDSIMSLLIHAQREEVGSSTYLTLSQFATNKGEAIFGDNVVYTSSINAIVIETPIKSNKSFNVYKLTFKLRALALSFEGSAVFPSSLQCVWSGWSGGSKEWGRTVNETYYNDNFISIKNNDDRKFIGKFIVSIDQSKNLHQLYKTLRGSSFILDSIDIGVSEPFGVDMVDTSYEVIITGLQFDFFSPLYRQAQIELTLVSGLV